MDAAPDTIDFIESGRLLFAKECTFIAGSTAMAALPPMRLPEIAFAGRSNVGKSSLVNALTGRKTLARVSHTPGRTQQLNFFELGDVLGLVDMPGYGYAAVSKATIEAWSSLIGSFLRGRATLMRVYLLIDSRHGLKPVDHEQMTAFDKAATSYAVVLTKSDALKASDRERRIEETRDALSRHPAAYPEVVLTSADSGEGVAELRAAVVRLLAERSMPHVASPRAPAHPQRPIGAPHDRIA